MNEKTLARLSLLCTLTGLAAVYGASLSARPRVTSISSIDNGFVGVRSTVSGKVIDYREHKDGHLFLKLQDQSGGVISVAVFSRTRSQLGDSIELQDTVEVTGEVQLYQGEFEVVPDEAKDLTVVHSAPTKLSGLTAENAGSTVKVQGTIVEREIVGSGNVVLVLSDGEGQIPVFVSSWIAENGLPEMHLGDTIRVDGWVQIYNGKLELKVASASHLHVVEAG